MIRVDTADKLIRATLALCEQDSTDESLQEFGRELLRQFAGQTGDQRKAILASLESESK